MREFTKDLAQAKVLNIGAKPDAPDKEGGTYEQYFPHATSQTIVLGPHDNSRHTQGDIMSPPDGLGKFDLVLAMSVIEHIDRPWPAAPHIENLVTPRGHLYITMPFFYPIHEGTSFGDHWRATPTAMAFLFPGLKEVRRNCYPSSIFAVRDRKRYWHDANSSYAGFSMLMRKP